MSKNKACLKVGGGRDLRVLDVVLPRDDGGGEPVGRAPHDHLLAHAHRPVDGRLLEVLRFPRQDVQREHGVVVPKKKMVFFILLRM